MNRRRGDLALTCCLAIAGLMVGSTSASAAQSKPILRAVSTTAPPVIDGDLSDPAWAAAGTSGGFVIQDTGEPAPEPTLAYALSDLRNLYLAFRCTEPRPRELRASVTRDSGAIWGDDCIEFNFDPAGGIGQIYQVKVNSVGAKEFLLRGQGHLDPGGIRAAARVGGDEYTIEIALPFAAVGVRRSAQVGMRWRVNFERLRTVGGEEGDSWAKTGGDWANPEVFGEVVIPGGLLLVEGLGHGPLSVGRPSGGFIRVRNLSRGARRLEAAVADAGSAGRPFDKLRTAPQPAHRPRGRWAVPSPVEGRRAWRKDISLAGGGQARARLDFPVGESGQRTYRWTLRDVSSGALLYSLERVASVAKAINAAVSYHRRELLADVDTRPWGKLPAGATVEVELAPEGGGAALHSARAQVLPDHIAQASLRVGELPAGRYEVRAVARDRSGKTVEPVLMESVAWPEDAGWAGAPASVRALNNLVAELLDVEPAGAGESYTFTNPRDGWVFISAAAEAEAGGELRIALDGESPEAAVIVHEAGAAGVSEAMRLLAAGEHVLRVIRQPPARLQRLVVRAVPALIYCQFQADPHVAEYGPYDWAFLQRYVLPHCNTIIGGAAEEYRPYLEQWKREGKRWIVGCGVPGLSGEATVTADEAEKYWGEQAGMQDPRFDGVIADEFFGGESEKYVAWTEAARRIARDPRFAGKAFIPYCGNMYEGEMSREFIEVVMGAGWPLSWEHYLPEQPSEAAARAYLGEHLRDEMRAWRAAQPGVERRMVVCFGYLSAPPESLNINPGVDYKVWMDLQFSMVANDPAFQRLYGVMEYLSSYADEEAVRWAARLYRHYCIEGSTEPLTRDPYLLSHLENPDFDRGLDGWTAAPAEPGGIAARAMLGYSWLEGRYPETSQGDTLLWMKRSARAPNVVSQAIKGLQPGRLYSLKMYTGDYGNLSLQQRHAVSISLEGVEALPEQSFQHLFHNCYSHHLGPYDDQHYAWMNYHWRVFRAKGREAKLTISDWGSPDDPGGPIGQELMFNFVEVQPYLEG